MGYTSAGGMNMVRFAGIRERLGNVKTFMEKAAETGERGRRRIPALAREWGRRGSFMLALLLACALVAGSLAYRARSTAVRASGREAMAAVPAGVWDEIQEGEEEPEAEIAEAEDTEFGELALRMAAPLEVCEVVGGYSPRALVWRPAMGEYAVHPGLDLAAPKGSPVRAIADGTVTAVYRDPALGWAVEMVCGGGADTARSGEAVTVLCAGLAASPLPREGQRVRWGETIGAVGDAPGEADLPPHIHLEMRQGGRSIDPVALLP